MWMWLVFAALANRSLISSMAEPLVSEISEGIPDSMYVYMEERSLKDQKSDNNDIEARRRSPLDMNFMRFGRRDYLFPQNRFYNLKDIDYNDEFSSVPKSGNINDNLAEDFVRSRRDSYKNLAANGRDTKEKRGNGKDYSKYVRFGRNFYETVDPRVADIKFGKRKDYTNFIRFGRNPFQDALYQQEDKRHTNVMRFGKKSTGFMRFG